MEARDNPIRPAETLDAPPVHGNERASGLAAWRIPPFLATLLVVALVALVAFTELELSSPGAFARGAPQGLLRGLEVLGLLLALGMTAATWALKRATQACMRAEDARNRIHRELRAISACNQVLVRAEDESTLLNDICRIVCEQAGYRMAWVGFAEHDDRKTIRPAAWAGVVDGYLERVQLTWAATERGLGPSGTALRSGERTHIVDFATDSCAVPWRDDALQRGYKSSVALPLKDESADTFGVLNIYSADADAFTPDEVRILEELASDLAFGIIVLRARTERKRMNQILALQEAQHRTVLETIPTLIVRYDTQMRRTYVNPAWERATGIAAADVVGVREIDVGKQHFSIPDAFRAKILAALQTGETQFLEFRWQNARSSTLVLDTVIVPERGDDGELVGVLTVGHDVGERVKVEQELRKSEASLRTLVQTIPDLVWLKDAEGTYLACNPAFERLFGASEGEIVGKTDFDFVDRNLAEAFRDHDRVAIASGKPNTSEEWLTFADNAYRGLFETIKTPMFDAAGNLVGVLGIARDITERKNAMESILKLSQAMHQSPGSIVITDASGAIEFVNASFTETTGYSFVEVVGENARILKSGATRGEEYQRLWRTISSGGVWKGELHNRKKTGELFWERATIAPIRNSDSVITHYFAVKEDISERKTLEEQLRHAQKMEAVGTLAGGVAHDFNNILTAITGCAYLLTANAALDDEHRGYVEEIIRSARQAANLTRSLLAFSRKQAVVLEPVSITDVILQFKTMLGGLVGEDVEFTLNVAADDMTIEADRGQLEQVLMNLVANSRDAMPSGGALQIETYRQAVVEEAAQLKFIKAGDYCVISVSDSGTGMRPEVIERIFEPFFTTKEVGKGTGLGLSMVYGIVKKHGGAIEVTSEVNAGTTFRVFLPLITWSQRGESDQIVVEIARGSEKVLLVEDNETVRTLLAKMLAKSGYRVIEAANGDEAIALFADDPAGIDLVISDFMMPGKNGKEMSDVLRTIRSDVKLLFVSGHSEEFLASRGLATVGLDYLPKPVKPDTLLAKVRELLDMKPLQGAQAEG